MTEMFQPRSADEDWWSRFRDKPFARAVRSSVACRFACLLTVFLSGTTAVVAQNWPSFRGPNAAGVADGQNLPITWDVETSVNIRWKTRIPGLGHSSPIIWGDRVFVTAAVSGDPHFNFRTGLAEVFTPSARDFFQVTWRVYCLNKDTGRIVWERTVHEGVPRSSRHPTSSHANSTPATDGQRLVVLVGDGLYTYGLNGTLLWKQTLGVLRAGSGSDPDYQYGFGNSPIIYKHLVIVQADLQKNSFLAAYDIRNGRRVWLTPRDELSTWGTPTIYDSKSRVELITTGRHIRGYDPLTGRELWRFFRTADPDAVIVSTPVVSQDLIFVSLRAIRPGATGDISLKDGAASNDYVAWTQSATGGRWHLQTPILYGDLLYTSSLTGVLSCYNARTGDRIYVQRLHGSFTASPVAGDGKLYFASEDGDVWVLKAGAQYELLARNRMGEALMATPAISQSMLIVRGTRHVFGIWNNGGGRPVFVIP